MDHGPIQPPSPLPSAGQGTPRASRPLPAEPQWVQCDGCRKWRRLPAQVDVSGLPEHWFCALNRWDPLRNRCEAPEEVEQPIPIAPPDGAAAAAAAQALLDADVLPVRYGDPRLASDPGLEFELPRAAAAKLTRRFLGPEAARDTRVVTAIARAGGLFAMYATYGSSEVCLEHKRQTVSPQDVLAALGHLGFEKEELDSLSVFLERDKKKRPKHTSGDGKKYRGVYQGSVNAWYSQISIGGQPIHLGSYAAPADAAKAYDRAIWSKLGVEAAALLNFPELIPESLPYVAEAKHKQMAEEAVRARQRDEKIRVREEKEAAREARRLEKEEKALLKASGRKKKRRKKEADPAFR